MEFPELSLAPSHLSNYESHEINLPMKRKQDMIQASVDLQLKDPLPLDWEQCLDLESGRMYYLNRKTLRKTWDWPKDQKLDLELNMSSRSIQMDDDHHDYYSSKKQNKSNSHGSNSMIALPCSNCHLLVIVSQSSPSCPNCKYVHSLLSNNNNAATSTPKCYDTLSLLN
ncbi:protein CURLY FLAG LEAF 1-like [Solanum dulcamara]|uniref:protein CURLY FLAG LEAF 1-like n=1 Tax=Solanum dulcamara TaxID=45834 RepID=UPI002485654E|nr:protein CURLY FLAG LEAF 1-like [Solanum dulcamara]